MSLDPDTVLHLDRGFAVEDPDVTAQSHRDAGCAQWDSRVADKLSPGVATDDVSGEGVALGAHDAQRREQAAGQRTMDTHGHAESKCSALP